MTKKQLEKYQKEFDEFVANVEKMGGRFLTEDELRYKINGGTDDIASDQTEATADGAGETQAGNENEDSSGKSEETAEEDDDKSFLESICEAVGGVVDAVGDAVSGVVDAVGDAVSDAAHAVGEFVEDVIDFLTGGSEDDKKTVEESSQDGFTGKEKELSADTTEKSEKSGDKKTDDDKNSEKEEKELDIEGFKETMTSLVSSPFLSDSQTYAKSHNIAEIMEMATIGDKNSINGNMLDLDDGFSESKKGGCIQAYNDCEIARAYVFPDSNSTIGFGVGGWGGCSSPDNPKSMSDNAGAHLMDIPNPFNSTTYHLDTVYFGVKVDF